MRCLWPLDGFFSRWIAVVLTSPESILRIIQCGELAMSRVVWTCCSASVSTTGMLTIFWLVMHSDVEFWSTSAMPFSIWPTTVAVLHSKYNRNQRQIQNYLGSTSVTRGPTMVDI